VNPYLQEILADFSTRIAKLEKQNAWQNEIIDELRMKLLGEIIKNTYANRTIENLQAKDDE
jgi:hypothetical protein